MTYQHIFTSVERRHDRPGWIKGSLVGGLLFAVGLPLVARMAYEPDILLWGSHQVTVTATAIAHLAGYYLYKRLERFPGVAATGTILPTFALTYGVVFLAIFFFRFDYSRFQAASSFLLSLAWYFIAHFRNQHWARYELAVVPGGKIDQLKSIRGVVWHMLSDPATPPGRVQGVVADLRADYPGSWERYIADCVLAGKPVYHVKQLVESLTGRVAIEHLSENTLGSLNPDQTYIGIKHAIDRVTALAALVLLTPLLIAVAIAIRLDSPGPVIFRQQRVGYRGEVFTIYKFRTMRIQREAPHESQREQAMTRADDQRVTRLGRYLRRSRIDELPQLLNVLRGEMSWIGPRPEAVVLSRWYESKLPFYRYRHIVRPGITGWAQVKQGHVAEVDDVNEKLYFDFYYIKNFSHWLDIVIIINTVKIMFTGFGSK